MDLQKKALTELQEQDDAIKLERRKGHLTHVRGVLKSMELQKKNLEKFCEDNDIELTDALGAALLAMECVPQNEGFPTLYATGSTSVTYAGTTAYLDNSAYVKIRK